MMNRRSMTVLLAASLAAGAALAQTKQVVKIGAIYPLSGSASFLGVPEERALKLKVD